MSVRQSIHFRLPATQLERKRLKLARLAGRNGLKRGIDVTESIERMV
jgi:hypothetical protein